jgi:putative transcriptional regulator
MKPELDLFTIMPEDKIPEKGTIVYLADHTAEGSVGFILNKKLEIRVSDAISGFNKWTEFLSMGGPVAPDTLHYLHNQGDMIPKSVWVDDNIFWGGDIDFIRSMIEAGKISKSQIRFFLGYSGWSAGQLEKELKENSWVIAKIKTDMVLNNQVGNTWKKVLRSLNNKYRMWADFPESPDMN